MADKSFGIKQLNLIGASGTPTITSPNNLNLNASTVAISTDVTIGRHLDVDGHAEFDAISVSGVSTFAGITTVTGSTLFAKQLNVSGVTTITGNLNAPGNYYVKLARTTDQTALNGADTLIGFSVVSDPNNWYSGITTRTTPTVAGTYHVDLMINWLEGTITNNQTNIQIRKNGNTFALSMVGIHTFSYTQNACGIVTMNGTTDYIDVTVYTSNPTSQVVRGTADGAWTKMEIFKIN
jgi:hypothetical protein